MKQENLLKIRIVSILLFCLYSTFSFAQEIIVSTSDYRGYNVSCHGSSDGWINLVVVGGNPPYLFSWSNGSYSKNQSNLTAGVYTVTVTDFAGDTAITSIELNEPAILLADLKPATYEGGFNISENGGHDGEIDVEVSGGVPPYTYAWSTGGTESKIAELTAGTYSLIVTGTNECTVSAATTLTEPTELQIVSITSPLHNGFNISCTEGNDGAINLTVTGGTGDYDYQWSNGAFTQNLSELHAGHYTVIVRDGAGTPVAAQITLTEPNRLEAQLTATVYSNGKNISCYDCANGHISTSISGGISPYTYQWNDGASSLNRSGLTANGYNVQVTDANGCMAEGGLSLFGPEREDWTMTGNSGTNEAINFIGTGDNKDLVIRSNNVERMRIKGSGNVEIKAGLKVDSASTDSTRSVYVDQQGLLRVVSQGANVQPCTVPTSRWVSNHCSNSTDIYNLPSTGNVGIGTMSVPAGYKLAVSGKIICEEVKVKLASTWPDYVFKDNYKLRPLAELQEFIEEEGHLPEIPSALEIEKSGNSIGDMQAKLLQKIEELTLYLLNQNKKLSELETENSDLNSRIDALSKRVHAEIK